ncbi:hypothetical protein [Streptomyces regalis]|uniref:WXG100 family type VII secretion target n=1 Tax=Streptomyces regalis TaxID=68262 RepID=A0A0X3UPC6_9ACTN|nr:hypothetical protein [Streptomyces regalis]KUL33997.1 hypothetical protein ADL12_20945 [Streptomyces regalis]
MSGAGSDGYRIHASGMDSEAGKLDRAGDDVGAIRNAVGDHMCCAPDALGGSDSGPAYDNFAAAWQAEAKTLEASLHELAGKVGISQRNYESADHDTIVALHSAGVDDGLTTMPVPAAAHPGTTTGLTPGAPRRPRWAAWYLTSPEPDPDVVRNTDKREEIEADDDAVGSGSGTDFFDFKAVGPGTTKIRLIQCPHGACDDGGDADGPVTPSPVPSGSPTPPQKKYRATIHTVTVTVTVTVRKA